MRSALIYSSKVWLTTVILGMRLVILIKILTDTGHLFYSAKDIFISAEYDIPIGLIACIPSWLIFTFLVNYISNINTLLVYKKLLLSLAAFFLAVLPLVIVFGHQLVNVNYFPAMLPELIGYNAITLAGVWFYNLSSIPKHSTI